MRLLLAGHAKKGGDNRNNGHCPSNGCQQSDAPALPSAERLRLAEVILFEPADGVLGELRNLINGRDWLLVVDVLRFDADGRIDQIHAYVGRGD